MEELGYNNNDFKMLYEMHKKNNIKMETPFGEISSMEIMEIVTKGLHMDHNVLYSNIQSK